MSIVLSDGATTVNLHPDLYWSDEHEWSPVEQVALRALTGALVVFPYTRIAGRPITLGPIDEENAWTAYPVLVQLRQWAAGAGQVLQLTLRGATRSVIFRHQDAPALSAEPVRHLNDTDSTDWFLATMKFTEI